MRITVLCTDLGVRIPGDKGASMHLGSITKAFAECGHDVQLVAIAGHGEPDALLRRLADHVLVPHPGRAEGIERERNKLDTVEYVVDEIGPQVAAFGPDVIYERLSLFGSAGLRIAASCPSPVRHVVEVNALVAEEEATWRGLHQAELARRVERRVLEAADLVVAVSNEVAEQVGTVAPATATAVVPNGVELDRFFTQLPREAARAILGLPANAMLAGFVGALRPWHGVDLALEALARTESGWHLAIAGDGPIRESLELQALAAGLTPRVHFLGHLDHERVATLLAGVDVALAPYPALDGFAFSPLKLYEYLAAGTPVIASAIGQIPEALGHGRWGALVPAGDVCGWAAALDDHAVAPKGAVQRALAARVHAHRTHGWAASRRHRRARRTYRPARALCRRTMMAAATTEFLEADPALAPHADAIAELCAEFRVVRTLRHVVGRRATCLVEGPDGARAVLKVFASQRAAAITGASSALAGAGLGDIVPASLAHHPAGHVGIVSFRPGVVLDELADDRFVDACEAAGLALARLHRSDARLDRTWTVDQELDLLDRRLPASLGELHRAVREFVVPGLLGAPVPSHRDCHPRQLVVTPTGAVAWIDLDDCATAPPGLDLGNLLAHLWREEILGRRSPSLVADARDAVLRGYHADDLEGPSIPEHVRRSWELVSLARLAGLAETRHGSLGERDALRARFSEQLEHLLPLVDAHRS
ncbi:MAG: glycosyltransferase [Ilumatobacteraceae bacterium]